MATTKKPAKSSEAFQKLKTDLKEGTLGCAYIFYKKATDVLADGFDIEIVEAHHNLKIDAPSGTAIMLANAVNEQLDNSYELTYDRHSERKQRPKKEIGMHAIRGGTIVGEHEVIFAGKDEIITLSHSARSKEVFAVGAVKAAIYMAGKEKGLYTMKDVIGNK